MKHIDYGNTDFTGGYLFEKAELNRKITIDAVWDRFSDTGRVAAFACEWKEGMDKKPHIFWDSDVAKWMEGAAYILKKHDDPSLVRKIEGIIDEIEKNMWDDGYFNSYYTVAEPENRFTNRDCHELYCAGHLMEAAVAYYEVTGKDRFLKLMERYADCIKKVFIDDDSASFNTPGHEEIELALVRMYHATKNEKYLEMAKFFVEKRGNGEKDFGSENIKGKYSQSHLPAREQKTARGHCVRALYFYCAMADLAYELNDDGLKEACKSLFDDITNRKMSVTGGLGASWRGEAFSIPYILPNKKAYNETCAAISMIFFAHRMLKLENNAEYADVIERVLYNGFLSGLSLDGKKFFYENPLEIDLKDREKEPEEVAFGRAEHLPITERVEVFSCSCCPPNINRILPRLEDYVYAKDGDTYYINQFTGSKMNDGEAFISQTTDYPVSGKVKIETNGVKKLAVRKPYWCENFAVNAEYTMENGYIVIENPSAEINIDFEMKPVLVQANKKAYNLNGRAAVAMGPIVYCCEGIDNAGGLRSLFIDAGNFEYSVEYNEEFGLNTLKVAGFRRKENDGLYFKYSDDTEKTEIRLIPYNCFANRGETDSLVWMNVK